MSTSPIKPKILCIDDERPVLDSLHRLLRQDFLVLSGESAEEGLKILEEHPDISVILTDHHLQGLSGTEFLHLARIKAPNAVRAILSGHIDLQQMSEAINRSEIHRLILKPWDNDYLLIQMKEALISHSILQEKDRLRHIAITDPVTGLTNHRYFQEKLLQDWIWANENEQPLSLLMIDIDNFKSCNDSYGHLIGDQILAEVGDRLHRLKESTHSISRYGGEEFALIMPKTDMATARMKGEYLRKKMEESPFSINTQIIYPLTVSIGIATQTKRQEYTAPSFLIAAADAALYISKRQGRNRVSCSHSTLDRN